jgi:hypothetical protein
MAEFWRWAALWAALRQLGTIVMERIAEASPRPKARTIGIVYLLYFLTAIFAVFLTKGLVVSGEAAATANNILAHEPVYRSGFAVGLIANALYVALTALFYGLFQPVSRGISLLAAFFGLAGRIVQISGSLFQLAPLVILRDSQSLSAFNVEQLQAITLLFLKLHAQTLNIALVFFACYDLLIGYLIFRSAFLPRILGVLLMIAGLGWLTFIWLPFAASMSSYVQPLGFLAELLLMLWLLVKGVDVSRWQEKALARQVSGA